MNDKKLIAAACRVEGCRVRDLLASRVVRDGDRVVEVVLIVGPVGYKKRIPYDDLGAPPPVSDAAVGKAPTTFRDLLPSRIRVVLEREGLADPGALRDRSDEELLEVDGIGEHTLGVLREILAGL